MKKLCSNREVIGSNGLKGTGINRLGSRKLEATQFRPANLHILYAETPIGDRHGQLLYSALTRFVANNKNQ